MPPTVPQHPTATDLTAFALGKLTPAAAGWIARHLDDCPACRTVAERAADGPGPDTGGDLAAPVPTDVPAALRDHPKYRVLRAIGRGGMGTVYLAEHRVMERQVAVKVINPALLHRPDAAERFEREIKAAAKLDHPNIVRAYDAETAGDLRLLVMEYVEGRSLADVVEAKPQPVAHACHYARQAALGLQHAHEHGMVHRDIKPHNLMLTPKGVVKVLDFGLAKVVREQGATAGLTQDNMVMGTPNYLAPEQAVSTKTADIRADIYALGCTLFHLLTGRPPFPGDDPLAVVVMHVQDPPPSLAAVRPEVPADLAAVVARMLAKDPAGRPQTPREVAEALAPFGVGAACRAAPGPARQAGPTRPRRRWLLAVAAGLLVAAGVATWAMVVRAPAVDGPAAGAATQPDEPDEFDPPPAPPAAAAGPDLFQKGTTWKGTLHRAPLKKGDKPTHSPITLTVLERDGETFQAHVVIKNPDIIRFVKKGMLTAGTIRWSRGDVAVIQGRSAGADTTGIVVGARITLYSGDAPGAGPAGRSRIDLTLDR